MGNKRLCLALPANISAMRFLVIPAPRNAGDDWLNLISQVMAGSWWGRGFKSPLIACRTTGIRAHTAVLLLLTMQIKAKLPLGNGTTTSLDSVMLRKIIIICRHRFECRYY